MQSFVEEQRFQQSPAAVLAKFTDPAFLTRKYTELGRQDIALLEHHRDDVRALMRIAYSDVAEMDLPDFARKFVPARQHVVQTVEWTLATRIGTLNVEPKGAPARIQAEMRLSDDKGGGCLNTISWKISCSVPLIGGKLEKILADNIRQKAAKDLTVSQRLLSSPG